ncbi:MAG: NTP transferase domain-containing protein [Longimicrobiales bacterium]|nr:NTP transferase domain-containing protein [Longimicrobiales bacterium]
MPSSRIQDAVVLAAGRGSRLGSDLPKPLVPVLGMPLLARTLATLRQGGVTRAFVVVGHRAKEVREGMREEIPDGMTVEWIHNDAWERPNGVSALAAADRVRGPFFLTMTDHVFSHEVLERLRRQGAGCGVDLAIDTGLDQIVDLDDATKVRVEDGRIVEIGKELGEWNAVDTGVFLATPALFDALREAVDAGEESLSAGVRRLAAKGAARVVDVERRMWQDVDTPLDRRVAERKLLDLLRKESDGPIARYLNRPLSLALTRLLVRTPITPNQVSVSTLVMSVIAAFLATRGDYAGFLGAGALFHLASVVDGTDGEIAKLKFMTSRYGEWVDTICDNLGYLAFLVGVIVGVVRAGYPDVYLYAGIAGFVATGTSIANLAMYLSRERGSGSFLSVEYGYQRSDGFLSRVLRVTHFLGKRDFFAFAIFVLAVIGHLPFGLILVGAGTTFILLPVTLAANLSSLGRQHDDGVEPAS